MMVFLTVALAVWCWLLPDPLERVPRPKAGFRTAEAMQPATVIAFAWPLAGFVFFGFVGLVIALATLGFVRTWLGRLERTADRKREAAIVADLPVALALIATVVKSGRSTESAFALVSQNLDDPLAAELQQIAADLERAPEPAEVWRNLESSFFGKVARTFARSAESGSGVVATVALAATDVRKARAETKRLAASRVAVKTAAPLGLCFMPAFLLVGIVPVVLGISSGVLGL